MRGEARSVRGIRSGLRRLMVGVALTSALAVPGVAQQVDVSSGSVIEIVADLKAGQYVWAPQIAPDGPMLLIVNLKSQRAVLYRNGVPIAASTVSTGKTDHETPTGVFTILEKQVEHHSSKYDDAPMPYMERLTWAGVALHAGHLPGYPASHGCIRLPSGFAKLLYASTSLGMTVVIADVPAVPRVAPTPTILSESQAASAGESAFVWEPAKAPSGPVSVIVSASDRRAVVLRNGVVIGSAPVTILARSQAVGRTRCAASMRMESIGSDCNYRGRGAVMSKCHRANGRGSRRRTPSSRPLLRWSRPG